MAATGYCPNCGLERREGERFCRNCGAALGTGATSLHESPVASPVAPTTEPMPPARAAPAPHPVAGPPAPLPAPPSAPHPVMRAPSPASSTNLPFKPLALGGGLALVVAVFLPWIAIDGAPSVNALDIPIQALWDLNAGDGPIKIGFVILALGAAAAGLSFVPRTNAIRRICGSVALAVTLGFALQLYRSLDQAGVPFGDVFSTIGIGVYVALAGAIVTQVSK